MGINLGSTRPWLDIAICLRITPQKACIMWHYSFYLAQRRLNVFMAVFSRIGLLWQLRTIRGGEGLGARVLLWGDVFIQPCGASLGRQRLLLRHTCFHPHLLITRPPVEGLNDARDVLILFPRLPSTYFAMHNPRSTNPSSYPHRP
jgi:hypothetical protein